MLMRRLTDIDRSFRWLGRFPLAVDLADTVRVVGDQEIELLEDDSALDIWITSELPRHPSARAARGRLDDVRELRDLIRELLSAHVRGESLPASGVQTVNETSSRSPSFPVLSTHGDLEVIEVNHDQFEIFAAEVARSLVEVISADSFPVAHCKAPRCGMFFVPRSSRQRWCSPECGNRARVARHAGRARRSTT